MASNDFVGADVSVSIPDYIYEVINCDEETAKKFRDSIRKWRNALCIEDVVRGRKPLNPRLEKAVKRRGESWFTEAHRKYAADAFDIITQLDKEHYARTGKHIRGFLRCGNSTQKEAFMFRFMEEYNRYMESHPHGEPAVVLKTGTIEGS